jgi:hypothetical protein
MIDKDLTLTELRNLVDFHTGVESDDHKHKTGFIANKLIEEHFPGYKIEMINFVDYGGEMLRRHPWIRAAFDAIMRLLAPRKGRLFSWILRKPLL